MSLDEPRRFRSGRSPRQGSASRGALSSLSIRSSSHVARNSATPVSDTSGARSESSARTLRRARCGGVGASGAKSESAVSTLKSACRGGVGAGGSSGFRAHRRRSRANSRGANRRKCASVLTPGWRPVARAMILGWSAGLFRHRATVWRSVVTWPTGIPKARSRSRRSVSDSPYPTSASETSLRSPACWPSAPTKRSTSIDGSWSQKR